MKLRINIMTSNKFALMVVTFLLLSGTAFILNGAAPAAKTKTAATPAASPAAAGKQFDTADQAADELLKAAAAFDVAALTQILGPDSDDLVNSEDQVSDKNNATAFVEKAKEKKEIRPADPKNPNMMIMVVGKDEFSLPIPIVKQKGKWTFDTKVGRQEILNRRIGTNELDAIEVCRGFVEAQHDYAGEKHDDSKVNQYAQRIISTPGKHDGLAWKNADGTWGGPVGEEVAEAVAEGYTPAAGHPYHGYFFKVLKGQGPAAPMGELDFLIGDAMIGGFALAAAPAEYRVTGVKTFIVGPDGVVYEKDLGKDTLKAFQAMDKYNPDKTWTETNDDWDEAGDDDAGTATAAPSPAQ